MLNRWARSTGKLKHPLIIRRYLVWNKYVAVCLLVNLPQDFSIVPDYHICGNIWNGERRVRAWKRIYFPLKIKLFLNLTMFFNYALNQLPCWLVLFSILAFYKNIPHMVVTLLVFLWVNIFLLTFQSGSEILWDFSFRHLNLAPRLDLQMPYCISAFPDNQTYTFIGDSNDDSVRAWWAIGS